MKNNKMMYLKRVLVLTAFLFASLGAYSQDQGEWKIPLSNPGSRGELNVDIKNGSIVVNGTGTNEVIVKYTSREKKVKDKDKEKTSDGLNRISGGSLDLEAYEKNNVVEVDADNWNQGIDLEITVPTNFDLHLDTYNNGKIIVKNVSGELVLENYNGPVTAENIKGSVVVDTYNGDIKVVFDEIKSDTPMSFVTYNGDVDLTMPSNTKASFKMKTKRGDIFEGFGMVFESRNSATEKKRNDGVYQIKLDEWVRGTINGGGPEFTMENYNGNLYIRSK